MSSHPYQELKSEYDRLLATVKLTRADAAMSAAREVIRNSARYKEAGQKTSVPASLIGVLDLRESDCDPRAALGQGDPWNQVSTHVPRGKGPFGSWVDAAVYYINFDHLNDNSAAWSMSYACWKGEIWNGFGPRNHGIFTGYLWAGTNHYIRGKYVADGVWDPNHVDEQIGIIAVLYQMVVLDPTTYIGTDIVTPSIAPAPTQPLPAPAQFSLKGTMWIQDSLNILMPQDQDLIRIDGNYGRRTREAIRNFQARMGLEQDGLAGDETTAAIDRELAKVVSR